MTQETVHNALKGHFQLLQKRPNIYQVLAPFFHEDGDMVDLFIEPVNDDRVRICDHGMTLMRLTYDIELTKHRNEIIENILRENRLDEADGNIYLETDLDSLLPNFFHYAQTVAKVTSLQYIKNKIVKNLFYDILKDIIETEFRDIPHVTGYKPLPRNKDLVVDYAFLEGRTPLYLFGVKEDGDKKALEICATCFELKSEKQEFLSAVVYENSDTLTRSYYKRLLRATDKPFDGIEHFKEEGVSYIQKVA